MNTGKASAAEARGAGDARHTSVSSAPRVTGRRITSIAAPIAAHQAALATTSPGAGHHRAATPAITHVTGASHAPRREPASTTPTTMQPTSTAAPWIHRRGMMTTAPASPRPSPGTNSRTRNTSPDGPRCSPGDPANDGTLDGPRTPASRSVTPRAIHPTLRHADDTETISSWGGTATRHMRSSTGRSIATPAGSTRHAPQAVVAAVLRTTSVNDGRPAGSSIGIAVTFSSATTAMVTPSISTPSSRLPAGRPITTLARPWLSMSNTVSNSVRPEAWHQQEVVSRQAHARAAPSSRRPGTSSAAAGPAGGRSPPKENSPIRVGQSLAAPGRGGSSASRRLSIVGRRRPASRTITSPT